jgi:hypothetical protein
MGIGSDQSNCFHFDILLSRSTSVQMKKHRAKKTIGGMRELEVISNRILVPT